MPRKITITAKCEILSNSSDEKSLFTLYGENLKKSDSFTYLGVTFGIDWRKHWERLKLKHDKSMAMIRDFGCNSYGFNFKTCGRLYKIILLIMEYGLPLCHKKKDLKIPSKSYNEGLKSIFGVSPEVL